MKKLHKIKLSTNAKKIIILCSMVGLLVVTGVLNFILNDDFLSNNKNNEDLSNLDNTNTSTMTTFFASYRTDRAAQRAEELSYLNSIISLEGASSETIASAEEKKMSLIKTTETELVVESLIKAKGFEDVVVTMTENNVNVIVSATELVSEQVSQILGIILQETSYTPSDVVVITYS